MKKGSEALTWTFSCPRVMADLFFLLTTSQESSKVAPFAAPVFKQTTGETRPEGLITLRHHHLINHDHMECSSHNAGVAQYETQCRFQYLERLSIQQSPQSMLHPSRCHAWHMPIPQKDFSTPA